MLMNKKHKMILLEEAKKNFDITDKASESMFIKSRSYLYINLFFLTFLFAFYRFIEIDLNSFLGIVFIVSFIWLIMSSLAILVVLSPTNYYSNPNAAYFLDRTEYSYMEDKFIDDLINSYEDVTDMNTEINYNRMIYADIAYYSIFFTILLLIFLLIIYLLF